MNNNNNNVTILFLKIRVLRNGMQNTSKIKTVIKKKKKKTYIFKHKLKYFKRST